MKNGLFLDLDETIISVSSEKEFIKHMYNEGKVSGRAMLRIALLFIMHRLYMIRDYDKAKRKTVRLLLKDKNRKETTDAFDSFFESRLVRTIYPEVYELVRRHKEKNDEIHIVSASLDFIAERFCRHLGATDYFAVRTETKDGMFTGEMLGPMTFSDEKAGILKMLSEKRNIDLKRSFALSDSIHDMPMLSAVGIPAVVNPDRKLLREAKKRNWKVLTWEKPDA